ncbi:LD-carboxypeptidase, partial [Acinetobacter baumannii]
RTKVYPHALDFTDYLAGSDQDRAAEFQHAFDDPETAAVLCTRGGYGCARIVDHIDWDRVVASRKALMGFSDITTFHLAIQR